MGSTLHIHLQLFIVNARERFDPESLFDDGEM
jgi:hypothetical protein